MKNDKCILRTPEDALFFMQYFYLYRLLLLPRKHLAAHTKHRLHTLEQAISQHNTYKLNSPDKYSLLQEKPPRRRGDYKDKDGTKACS